MKKIIIIILFLSIVVVTIVADTPLMFQLKRDTYQSLRDRNQNIPLQQRLNLWFPNHFVIFLDGHYYLSTPRYNDIRSDFYIKYNIFNPGMAVIPDTTATFTPDAVILRNRETIPASGLTENEFYDIKNQLAWLTVLFRTLGSPVPELMLSQNDEVETYVIVNEYDTRQMVILPSFAETIKKLNQFYEGYTAYFRINEIIKMNNRLEFYGTMFLRDIQNNRTDFVDVRFHTNRQNQIDLVMFFIYRNVPHWGGAFPSSHVAIALTLTLLSFRYFKKFSWLLLINTIFLSISTVFCHYHYFIDVLAGYIFGIVMFALSEIFYLLFGERQKKYIDM